MLKFFLAAALLFIGKSDEAVFTLTSENFDEFITSHSKVLVEFYAPWCGHCKALAPEYEKAATELSNDESVDAVLAKVDATVDKELAGKYGVQGFPTLKYFTGDVESPTDYTGGRTSDTIVQWLHVRSLPAVSQLSTNKELEDLKKKSKVTVVGFFAENTPGSEALAEIAEKNRESFVVGQVTSDELTKSLNAASGQVHLYANWNEEPMVHSGEIDQENIMNFINEERFPLVDPIGPENYKDYMDRGLPLVWISVDGGNDEAINKAVDTMTPYAKDFKGKLSFIWVDNVKYKQHVENLGIKMDPGFIIVEEPKKYLYEGDLYDAEALKKFFTEYGDGSLIPFLKSEPVPETNDEDVFVLVGSEFENVIGHDDDVFLEFYAPWCGHCKRLAPEYEKVGAVFKDVANLKIAKIDATENDTPENISGFPTLFFYPKGTTEGIKYEGERTAQAIVDWLKEKSTANMEKANHDEL